MFRRRTSRRTLKWAGTVACVLLATAFVASWRYRAGYCFELGAHGIRVVAAYGFLNFGEADILNSRDVWDLVTQVVSGVAENPDPHIELWPGPLIEIGSSRVLRWIIKLPLWMPFVLLAIPTALLWRLDRRRPLPGHCKKCNYDLTGNTSGRCPECGAMVQAARKEPC